MMIVDMRFIRLTLIEKLFESTLERHRRTMNTGLLKFYDREHVALTAENKKLMSKWNI